MKEVGGEVMAVGVDMCRKAPWVRSFKGTKWSKETDHEAIGELSWLWRPHTPGLRSKRMRRFCYFSIFKTLVEGKTVFCKNTILKGIKIKSRSCTVCTTGKRRL